MLENMSTIEYKGYTITIGQDPNADDPENNWNSTIERGGKMAFDDSLGFSLSSREEAESMAKSAIDKYGTPEIEEQGKLEDWLQANGYEPEDEYEEFGVMFTKYSKLGIGVRIERNL